MPFVQSSRPIVSPRWIVALTGASGVVYGVRLIDVLSAAGVEVHVIISEAACRVLQDEMNIAASPQRVSCPILLGEERWLEGQKPAVNFHHIRDIGAIPASGSVPFSGMVVVPCSMGSLAAIAQGLSHNLIHRAADVTLKERRPLIVVPRETPLSLIHIENMRSLALAGATILPAMPGFYHRPAELSQIVDMLVQKITDMMGVAIEIAPRWDAMAAETQASGNQSKVERN